jgi:hypothetical protein
LPYFTWHNLQGFLSSAAIGLLVYGLSARRWGAGQGRHRRRRLWPAGMSLYTGFYRPLWTKWLPGIGQRLAAALDRPAGQNFTSLLAALSLAGGRLFGFIDRLGEAWRALAAEKVAQQDEFTFHAAPKERRREYDLWRSIGGSLSYSLLLFSLGLLAAMIFTLLRYKG